MFHLGTTSLFSMPTNIVFLYIRYSLERFWSRIGPKMRFKLICKHVKGARLNELQEADVIVESLDKVMEKINNNNLGW